MTKRCNYFILLIATFLCFLNVTYASPVSINLNAIPSHRTSNSTTAAPSPARLIIPPAPQLNAKGYVLMDANSGQILAEKNMHQRMAPASLTKMMTLYIISNALKNKQISMNDKVHISKKAWRMGGSKMFVKAGDNVAVKDLIQGIVVQSGNDACTAMAEYIAGTEEAFAGLMNQTAAYLGMKETHYTDSTGLPHANHYSTPYDMAILTRALINDFPEYYGWYKQKWFTYNKIKQPNRNRLLWRDPSVDGLKTGHTPEAGYCLVSSAKRNDMRLIAIVMGTRSDEARNASNEALLNYGFRFFKTQHLFDADQPITQTRVWFGHQKMINLGVSKNLYITVPTTQSNKINAQANVNAIIKAPIQQQQPLGQLIIYLDNKQIRSVPLVALHADVKGGLWTRFIDGIVLLFKKIIP
jgi:D-alanyl-D-alanine carboxypeptidase (penicillin-binding protein 5/6)